jgi:ribosome-associated protein
MTHLTCARPGSRGPLTGGHCSFVTKSQKTKGLRAVLNLVTILDKETFTLIPLRSEPTSGEMLPPQVESPTWLTALRAAESKKASETLVLDLREISSLADYFFICSASNQRQAQAIWDEIAKLMKEQRGDRAISVEGYGSGEWILGDFGDLIVHVFTPEKRVYYDLERLWRNAAKVPLPVELPPVESGS